MSSTENAKLIVKRFENNLCIFCDSETEVESVATIYDCRQYKCNNCGNFYTARVVLKAISKLFENGRNKNEH